MKSLNLLLIVIVSTLMACAPQGAETEQVAPEPGLEVAADIDSRRAQFVQKELSADVSHLSDGDRAALKHLVAAAERGGYRLIDLEGLRERYQKDPESLLLVDTREEPEFRAGHIRNARLFSMTPTWWGRFRSAGKMKAFLGADKNRFIGFY